MVGSRSLLLVWLQMEPLFLKIRKSGSICNRTWGVMFMVSGLGLRV